MKLKEDLVKRLRDGEVTLLADHSKPEQMDEVLKKAFPKDVKDYIDHTEFKYYYCNSSLVKYWNASLKPLKGEITPLADFFEFDMGELEGFPKEIINAMLDKQERQGNKRDIEVFKKNRRAHKDDDGFGWRGSIEGYAFWRSVIYYKNFKTYFDKYPKEETSKNKPKTAEERDKLVEDLQAMTFEPTLEEAVTVLEDNHFMERKVNQAIDVVVKHLKNVKKG